MKTTPGRRRTRYRNEAVFRSAQRLISVPTTSAPPSAPRSISTNRGIAYLVGAALLFAVGVLVGLRWRAESSAITPAALAQAGLVDGSKQPVARDATSPATPGASSSQGVVKPFWRPNRAPRSGPASSPPGTDSASFGAPRSSPSVAGEPAAVTTTLVSVAAGPEFTLRGRLNSDASPSAAPLEFELSLRRDASVLTGVVRYFSPEGGRVLAHAVRGEINAERVVELRETSLVWRRSTPSYSPPVLEPYRNFIFNLPAANTAGEFTGLWTSYARNDNSSGPLTLWFSAPW